MSIIAVEKDRLIRPELWVPGKRPSGPISLDRNFGRSIAALILVDGTEASKRNRVNPTYAFDTVGTKTWGVTRDALWWNDSVGAVRMTIGQFDPPMSMLAIGVKGSGQWMSILRTNSTSWYGFYSDFNGFGAVNNNWTTNYSLAVNTTRIPTSINRSVLAVSFTGSRLAGVGEGGVLNVDTSGTTVAADSNRYRLHFGAAVRSTIDNAGSGSVSLFALWRRALPDNELIALAKDPYLLFKPAF